LQVDLKKAFKSIARPAILKDLEHQCPSMMPWVQQAFQPAPLLIGRELNFCFLFSAGIHAALGALPPGGTMHSWYLDDGVFMGSLVEVEGVLAALQQALPPPGPGTQHAEDHSMDPGLVIATSPLAAATRLHLEAGTEVQGVAIHSPLYPSPWAPTWAH